MLTDKGLERLYWVGEDLSVHGDDSAITKEDGNVIIEAYHDIVELKQRVDRLSRDYANAVEREATMLAMLHDIGDERRVAVFSLINSMNALRAPKYTGDDLTTLESVGDWHRYVHDLEEELITCEEKTQQ